MLIRAFFIGRQDGVDNSQEMEGWGFDAPVDFQPLVLEALGAGNVMLTGWSTPNGIQVWHPIVIVPIAQNYEPKIGVRLHLIGHFGMMTPRGPQIYHVFREGDWPTAKRILQS